jgi:hypothetical protein
MNLYQAWDTEAKITVGPIMAAQRDTIPTRSFVEALKDKNSLGQHPTAYELRIIGTQDDDGSITGEKPVTIITGAQVIAALDRGNDNDSIRNITPAR